MAPSDTSFSLLKELGLTNNQIKIYEAILGNGLLTIGEIAVLTGLELDVINTSLSDLLAIKLVKSVKGGLTRYYATLPFLSEMLIGQKDMILSLQGIIEQVKVIKERFIESKKDISGSVVPKAAQEFAETLRQNLIEPVITVSEGAREAVDSLLTSIESMLKQKIITDLEEMKEKLDKALDIPNHLSQSFAHLQAQGETIIEQILRTRNAKVFSLLKSTSQKIKELLNTYQKENEDVINTNLNAINRMYELSTTQINLLRKTLEEFAENIEKTLLQGKEAMGLIEKELMQIENINNIIETHVSQYNEETEKKIESIRKNLVEVLDKLEAFEGVKELQGIKMTIEMTYSEFLGFKLDSGPLKNSIKLETKKIMENVANSIEATFKTYLEAVSSLNIEELNKSLNEQITLINQTKDEILKLLDTQKEKIVQNTTVLLQELMATLNQISEKEKEITSTYIEEINKEVDRLNNEFSNRVKTMNSNAEEIISNVFEQMATYLNQQHDEILGKHAELSSIFNSVISTSEQTIDAAIENTKEAMIKPIDHAISEMGKITQEITNRITESIHVFLTLFNGKYGELRKLAEEANNFTFDIEINTWGIISTEAAYAILLDLLMRSKRQCTIILPELKLDIIDKIEKKRMTRIELVTDLDIEHDRRLISKIKQKGNITLRSYKKQDFLACIRDEEEAIICSFDKNGNTNGIKTIDPELVQILKLIIKDKVIRDSKSI